MKARQDCKGATLDLLGEWHYTGECGFYALLHLHAVYSVNCFH